MEFDYLSDGGIATLFQRYKGNEDKVLDFLRVHCDAPNGDIQAVLESYEMRHGSM